MWLNFIKRRDLDTDIHRGEVMWRHMWRRWSCEAFTSQEPPRTTGQHLEQGRARRIRGSMDLPTPWFLIASLQNCEIRNSHCFKYQFLVLSYSSPQQTNAITFSTYCLHVNKMHVTFLERREDHLCLSLLRNKAIFLSTIPSSLSKGSLPSYWQDPITWPLLNESLAIWLKSKWQA